MADRVRLVIEYMNYGFALLLLLLFALGSWLWGRRQRRYYARGLGL